MDISKLTITRSQLRSRVIRELVGERLIDTFSQLTHKDQFNEDGGLIGTIFNIGKKVVGFLVSVAANALGFVLKNLWDICVQSYYEIKNFDWNQTDANIKQEMDQSISTIFGALGGLVGTGGVWLTTLGLAGVASIQYPVISGYVALKLAEEGGDEIRSRIVQLLTVTRNVVTKNVILSAFLTARKLKLFGLAPVTTAKKPWTISQAVEDKVEAIKDTNVKAFLNQFLESVEESIIEAGYVVSFAIDDFYQSSKMAQRQAFGAEKVVEITPDTRVPDETLVLRGQQKLLMPAMQNSLMTHRLVQNRDIGQYVGQPVEDYLRAKTQLRKLTITFRSKEKPPYRNPDYSQCKTVSYDIPDAKVGLTWQEIKTAAKHWTWGKYRCTANLDNGRQMAVYGATPGEAESKLRELKTLTTANIITLSVTEEKDRNAKLKKEAIEMYPSVCVLLVRRPTATDPNHVAVNGTGYNSERVRFKLYHDSEPEDMPPLQ